MKYIGTFGPANNPIATFNGNGEIVNVRIGETIDGKFVLRSIGIESVEIGYVGFPRRRQDARAARPVTFTKRYRQSDQQITHADHPGSKRMKLTKAGITAIALSLTLLSCTSYNAFQKAKTAEQTKDWDQAVIEYQKALDVDPSNSLYQINLSRAKLEASRVHFQKGKSLRASALNARGEDQIRLTQLAATELELVIKLDPTNQYAAVEYGKAVNALREAALAGQPASIDELKKRAKANITKSAPPQLSPTSDQPITLSFPHETPVKEIYKALGGAFGINILFDQAVKDDRIAIELKDVTAQQALERVMQAANHFYKALDEHTIIIVPDNPQARRDYEDLVIRTFYLSNGDAEQVTNVVRTMIEARNVFPLKALNAITIRDTADKVRIAEKIIEANDKAKAEVVVDVELLQIDLDKQRDIGAVVQGLGGTLPVSRTCRRTRTATPFPTQSRFAPRL